MRRNLLAILEEGHFVLKVEYTRLFNIFYEPFDSDNSICDLVERCFLEMNPNLIKRCVSLNDFDMTYGFRWESSPRDFDLNYFLLFCEYIYNFSLELYNLKIKNAECYIDRLIKNVKECVSILGYKEIYEEGKPSIFVENKPEALAVAEIVEPKLGYKVMAYNHHKLKGDIEKKKEILILLGKELEPKRKSLQDIKSTVESDFFFMLNNLNIRHNNITESSKNYKKNVAEMDNKTLEEWYDETYQLGLFAFLELDNAERKERVKNLKENFS